MADLCHPSDVNQMSARNSWDLVVKSQPFSRSGSVSLRQLISIHGRGLRVCFVFKEKLICVDFIIYRACE